MGRELNVPIPIAADSSGLWVPAFAGTTRKRLASQEIVNVQQRSPAPDSEGLMTSLAAEPQTVATAPGVSRLYTARALRGFGDGFAIIILPAYMTRLGYDPAAIGIVATASLLGT